MIAMILICALSAGGLLLLSWAVFGKLIAPLGKKDAVILLRAEDPAQREQEIRAWSWLFRSGFLAAPLVLCSSEPMSEPERRRREQCPGVCLCEEKEVYDRLEMELEKCSRNRN